MAAAAIITALLSDPLVIALIEAGAKDAAHGVANLVKKIAHHPRPQKALAVAHQAVEDYVDPDEIYEG